VPYSEVGTGAYAANLWVVLRVKITMPRKRKKMNVVKVKWNGPSLIPSYQIQ
jgi:hypothetical protein